MGCMSALGGSPLASSMAVTPSDHISACEREGGEGGVREREESTSDTSKVFEKP